MRLSWSGWASLGVSLGLFACGGSGATTGSGGSGTTTASATTGTGGASTTTGSGGASTTTGAGGTTTTTTTTTSGTGGMIDPAKDAACSALAEARCQKLDACTSATGVKIRYGTTATCVARFKISCLEGLDADGSGATVATTNACAAALGGSTCDQYFDGPPVAACAIPVGTRAAGQGCVTNAQCASSYCAQPPNIQCGVCSPTPQTGDSCAGTGDCGSLACGGKSELCVPYGTAGVACDKDNPCHSSFFCVGSFNGMKGTCQLGKTNIGDGCDPNQDIAPDCNHDLGLRCDDVTFKCVNYQYAVAGQACGKINGGKTLCTDGAECEIASGQSAGFCMAPAADGAACDTKSGPPCLRPAKCITGGVGTSGICKLENAALCP